MAAAKNERGEGREQRTFFIAVLFTTGVELARAVTDVPVKRGLTDLDHLFGKLV